MFCKKCDDMFYASAISNGKCKECGKSILTPHLPPYKVCEECSAKLGLCEQCGEKVSE